MNLYERYEQLRGEYDELRQRANAGDLSVTPQMLRQQKALVGMAKAKLSHQVVAKTQLTLL